MEIDFTNQIKKLKAQKECGCTDDCNCEGNCEGSCDCQQSQAGKHSYPGKNVKRRKDGVPQKKQKKRACKKGEYRDKGGNLKKTKGEEIKINNPGPQPKDIDPSHLESNPNFNKENIEVQETELPLPPTKGLENPRNMNEYYKNLYKKVKGLD